MQLLYSVRWQSSDGNVAQQPPHPPPQRVGPMECPLPAGPGIKALRKLHVTSRAVRQPSVVPGLAAICCPAGLTEIWQHGSCATAIASAAQPCSSDHYSLATPLRRPYSADRIIVKST